MDYRETESPIISGVESGVGPDWLADTRSRYVAPLEFLGLGLLQGRLVG